MKFILTITAILGMAATPAALAQGCCSAQSGTMAGCPMGNSASGGHASMQAAANDQASTHRKVFMEPVQSVYDNYITVQGALAQDSLKGVSTAATAMAKAIHSDSMKMLSPKLAQQAEALAKAKDLGTTRDAFKSLSDSLISYLKEQKVPVGAYYVAYCPMAKASWLQTSKTILNPYMGASMVHCGQIKT
jgi:Protein of unknown function (DUF3347)